MITELEARVDEDPVQETTEREQVSVPRPWSYGERSRFCFERTTVKLWEYARKEYNTGKSDLQIVDSNLI